MISGQVSIPDKKSANLVHPAGRDWQNFHTVRLKWIGGLAILGMIALLIIFYMWRGTIKIEGGRSGRKIVRFNGFERFTHWLTASTFVVLGITGLNITFGRALILPWLGPEAFSAWSEWAKIAHNYLSFAFTLGVRADVPDVDRTEFPDRGRHRVAQEGRRHVLQGRHASRRPGSSTPARRCSTGSSCSAAPS